MLDTWQLDFASTRQSVEMEFGDFKNVHINTDNDRHYDHPSSTVLPENINKVHKIGLEDQNVKMRRASDASLISYDRVFTIY